MNLDDIFEQKNEVAKVVEELEKVDIFISVSFIYWCVLSIDYCKISLKYQTRWNLNAVWFNRSFLCLQAMSNYGYEIVQTLIVDIEADVHVKKAMNEINAGKTFTSNTKCPFYHDIVGDC